MGKNVESINHEKISKQGLQKSSRISNGLDAPFEIKGAPPIAKTTKTLAGKCSLVEQNITRSAVQLGSPKTVQRYGGPMWYDCAF